MQFTDMSRDMRFPTMWHFGMNRLSATSYNIQGSSKGSDQTARMRRLIRGFTGRTYCIVGHLMSRLICEITSREKALLFH